MKAFILNLLVLVIPRNVHGGFESFVQEPVYQTDLSDAAVEIIRDFFTMHQGHIHVVSANSEINFDTVTLVNDMLYKVRGLMTYIYSTKIVSKKRQPSSYNIIVVDSYAAFQSIYKKLSDRLFNFGGYFLIVISTDLGIEQELTLQRIFSDCYNMYMTNVNVLVQRSATNSHIIDMFTYFPFKEKSCRDMTPVLQNYYENGSFLPGLVTYPSKTKNCHKCEMIVVTWNYPPHMILRHTAKGEIKYDGIDGSILHTLAEKMNFTVRFDLTAVYRGNVMWNGSATGALSVIINRRGNITLCAHGSMFTRPKMMSTSANYYSAGVVFAVPTVTCYTSFEKLFLIFGWKVWALFFGNYLLGACILACFKIFNKKAFRFIAGDKNHSPHLNMFGILTGITIPGRITRSFARYMFIFWTVLTLVLRNAYQSAMFDYLQKNEPRPDNSELADLLKKGYTLYLPSDAMHWFEYFPDIKGKITPMNMSLWEYFREMADPTYKGITLTTDIQVDYYNFLHKEGPHIRILEQRLFSTPQSIFYPKYSFLVKEIDYILQDCLSGGLVNHWVKTYLHQPNKALTSSHRPVSLGDLHGLFHLKCGLTVLAILIFSLEVFVWKLKAYKRRR